MVLKAEILKQDRGSWARDSGRMTQIQHLLAWTWGPEQREKGSHKAHKSVTRCLLSADPWTAPWRPPCKAEL